MLKHVHVRAHRTVGGTVDAHRFVVRPPYLDRELAIAKEMGYEAEVGTCSRQACIGPEPALLGE